MSVPGDQRKKAENEAKIILEELKKQHAIIRETYKNQTGMDRGAAEIKKATQEAMKKIAGVRKKYGIPEPESDGRK